MPQVFNPSDPVGQDELARLVGIARAEHLAIGRALGDALARGMNAGDALLALRARVPAGKWQAFPHGIPLRSVRVYVQLAKNRAVLERQSSAAPLSIAAALRWLRDPGEWTSAGKSKAKAASPSFDAYRWWNSASLEQQHRFLLAVGLSPLLAALPPAWRSELEARVIGLRTGNGDPIPKAALVLRKALSLIKTARNPGTSKPVACANEQEAVAALHQLLTLLIASDFDLNDVTLSAAKAKARRRAA
jgi:hypothetical protein